jgi:hypothetical protein
MLEPVTEENPAMDLLGTVSTIEDQIVDTLETAEGYVVETFKTVTGAIEPVMIEVPLPFADQLPEPGAVVDNVANFAVRIVKNQQAFAHKLLDVVSAARSTDAAKPTIVRQPAAKTA